MIAGLAALAALGSLASVAAQDSKPAGGVTTSSLKESVVDLGNGVKLEMVLLPAGEFMMGSPDDDNGAFLEEKPPHRVQISKPFSMGKYSVTQEQWEAVMGSNPSHFKGPKNPVENVSWDDCQQFLEKLNAKVGAQGGKFVLPTEAQWEYACRAGSKTRYSFGDNEAELGEYAWYAANSGDKTHPVGGKKPNSWGLYDVHGNVWQWCADWYDEKYDANSAANEPAKDPSGPATGLLRVARGGSWLSTTRRCRSADRFDFGEPGLHFYALGLRVCQVPAE
jgi:formylglycine-generating enzyme required for sulfatase activity